MGDEWYTIFNLGNITQPRQVRSHANARPQFLKLLPRAKALHYIWKTYFTLIHYCLNNCLIFCSTNKIGRYMYTLKLVGAIVSTTTCLFHVTCFYKSKKFFCISITITHVIE